MVTDLSAEGLSKTFQVYIKLETPLSDETSDGADAEEVEVVEEEVI